MQTAPAERNAAVNATKWLRIVYRDFWDYPRAFFCRREGTWVYAVADFDEELDDFGGYVLFDMGDLGPRAFRGSWLEVPHHARQVLGTVALDADAFDMTRRKRVLRGALESMKQ